MSGRSYRASRRARALGSTLARVARFACVARFFEPPLKGNDRRTEEPSHPDRRDLAPFCRRVRCISAQAKIPSAGFRYWEGFGLVVGGSAAHCWTPSVFPNQNVPTRVEFVICIEYSSRNPEAILKTN